MYYIIFLTFIIIFILLKTIITIKNKYILKQKLEQIFPSSGSSDKNLNSVQFKWIYDVDKPHYTIEQLRNLNPKRNKLGVVSFKMWGIDGFQIYINDTLIVSRKCLKGFYYTEIGCSRISACYNKNKNEVVTNGENKYILYKCDGHDEVKDIITSYPNGKEQV